MSSSVKIIIGILVVITFSFNSCYYDNFEELNPKDTASDCDTGIVTYSKNIEFVIQSNCVSCHSKTKTDGGIALDEYQLVKASALSNKLYSSVVWDGKASPMPKGTAVKINNCSIVQLKKLIENGCRL